MPTTHRSVPVLGSSLPWVLACAALTSSAAATPTARAGLEPRPGASATQLASKGRPRIKLNRLTLPDIPEASYYKKHLQRSLEREARLADWGAESGAVIEYRFRVDSLRLETAGDVLRVYCSATGELPGRKTATSRLEFSGDPSQRQKLALQVLDIVARGVITRLAQIEHARRNP